MSLVKLADLLKVFEGDGQLRRIHAEVDPLLEIAEITGRVCREGGPALLFSRVKGHDAAVVTNLLGTPERLCRALNIDSLEQLADRAFGQQEKTSAGMLARLAPWPRGGGKFSPKIAQVAPAQQIVHLGSDVDLDALPALQSWPDETRRCLAGVVVSQSADSDRREARRYDLAILDANRLAISWPSHQPIATFFAEHERREEKMPIAVVLGADAATSIAAAVPLPADLDPWQFVGQLRDESLSLVKCRTHALHVPSEAELIVEGTIDAGEETVEAGPIAGAGGYYRTSTTARVVHVDAVTYRSGWTFPAIVPGAPPHESSVMGKAIERMTLRVARCAAAELTDLALPDFGGGQLVVASIRKSFPHQAEKVAGALWGVPWLMRAKMMVIVDQHVDVHDHREVFRRVVANVLPGRDVQVRSGPPDPLDHATPVVVAGNKLLLDATAKLPAEHDGPWPGETTMSPEIVNLVSSRWAEYGLGGG